MENQISIWFSQELCVGVYQGKFDGLAAIFWDTYFAGMRVFNGCRLAVARGKPWLAGKWEDITRHKSFEWKTKRDPMGITVSDQGYVVTFRMPQTS
jgi:hypothetical protein